MEESNKSAKPDDEKFDFTNRVSLAALIATRDQACPSPEVRFAHIISLLEKYAPELNDWDLTCFAACYLGVASLLHPWLAGEEIKKINMLVYTAHYNRDEHPESGVK